MVDKLFVATKAVIVYRGKILIIRESGKYIDGTNVGKYDMPGGRLKPGEHYEKALEREVLEETGLKIKIGKPIAVTEWRPIVKNKQWQIVAIFFKSESLSSKIKLSDDHDAYEWIDPKKYKKYNLIKNLEPIFKEYIKLNK